MQGPEARYDSDNPTPEGADILGAFKVLLFKKALFALQVEGASKKERRSAWRLLQILPRYEALPLLPAKHISRVERVFERNFVKFLDPDQRRIV